MIKKEMTVDDKLYLIGFKEVGSDKDGIECHVLEKGFIKDKSVFHKLYLKGIAPDYRQMALFTIVDYQMDCERKENLLNTSWV
jgi:hypothetical protein